MADMPTTVSGQGPSTSAPTTSKVIFFKKPTFWIVLSLIALLAAGIFGYLAWQADQRAKRLTNPAEAAKVEADELVKKVGLLILLPADETPVIVTVKDVSKLKSQEFFKNAEDGDKILIYTKSKQAILYRPAKGSSKDKIIQVGPVNIGQTQSQ